MGILSRDRRTPGQRVDAALAGQQLARAEAVALVPVGTAATSEATLRELDPTAAAAFGITTDDSRVTRANAMRVPAVRRGRALIAGTIGTLPLVCYRTTSSGAVETVDRPLLRVLDPRTTPAYTITWTVDDLLFYGVSWWRVLERDATGYPTAAERLHPSRVTVQLPSASRLARVYVDGRETDDRDLIRFDGPDEGVLAYGASTIRLALALMRAGQRVADDDWSGYALRPVEGAPELSNEQVTELLTAWSTARQQHSTAYLNRAVDLENIGVTAQQRQLTELAQYVSSELARLLNLPASRIGAPQGSGMTYTNVESDRRDLLDTTLAQYLAPIYQRLSLGDVTPNGQRVAVDLSGYLRGTTTELVAAGQTAITAGLTDAPEWRTRVMGLPPRSDLPTPTPSTAGSETP